MDGRDYLCRVTCHHRDAGIARPGDAAGVPHPRGAGGDDFARCRGVHEGGVGRALPGTLVCRTGSALDQADHADGPATVQDARDGAEGDLGPSAGLQPAPCGHGPSRPATRGGAAPSEPARDTPDFGSLSQSVGADALDRTREYRPDCSEGNRQSPRGNPAGPLRAASVQATPEAVSSSEGTAAASPRTLGNSCLRLQEAPFSSGCETYGSPI